MFECRMKLNWTIDDLESYEYDPVDSKFLTRQGAILFEELFDGVPDSVREGVLGVAPAPSEDVPLPDGSLEECVTLLGVRTEIQRRLTLLEAHGWQLSVMDSPENEPIQYKYKIDPPECDHSLLVMLQDDDGSTAPFEVSHPNAGARGIVCATLEFYEVEV